ncbi:MAG TPA: hypothetical protein VMS04_15165 [Vicinamibacterales bacterium]|nr:hypothetical protein [Vicinamibacterales bacterium]
MNEKYFGKFSDRRDVANNFLDSGYAGRTPLYLFGYLSLGTLISRAARTGRNALVRFRTSLAFGLGACDFGRAVSYPIADLTG